MSSGESTFQLPKQLERWLAALSRSYLSKGKREHAGVLVNARVRVHEGWTHDNWDGGTDGHALVLGLEPDLYLAVVERKGDLSQEICRDLNQIHHVQHEFVAEVLFEMNEAEESDWRAESGLLKSPRAASVQSTDLQRIWGDTGYRVFLSHKAEEKARAKELKTSLALLGVACFVAHEDIKPTQAWQTEIERALASMDAFVALMTKQFHESDWTDQEVGFAFGRGVPLICVRLGRDPYGFIGKFQALSSEWDGVPKGIATLLLKDSKMIDALTAAIRSCVNWERGNKLGELLPGIEHLSEEQARNLVEAFNENAEARGSFGLNGLQPRYYGDGLVKHLARVTGRQFEMDSGAIREVKQ